MSEMSDFERSLAGLTPRADLDRDQMLYRAGARAGARKPRFVIPALMLAVGFAVGGASGWSLREPERPFVAAVPAPEPAPPMAAFSYGMLQQRYLQGDFSTAVTFEPGDSTGPAETLGQQRGKLLQGDAAP